MKPFRPFNNKGKRTGMVHPVSLLRSAVALILAVVLWWAVASWYEQRLLADTRQRVQSGLAKSGMVHMFQR